MTTHHIDQWQFTRQLCADGQAVMDEWDKALARVKLYQGDVSGGTWDAAGGCAKAYYHHRATCGECELEWRKEC